MVATGQWWSKQQSAVDRCWLEQLGVDIPLHEWILLEKHEQPKLSKAKNIIRDAVVKKWEEIRSTIAPETSPISFFFYHPTFLSIRKDCKFDVWKKVGFWRFVDCIKEGHMKTPHLLADRLKLTPILKYQEN